LLKQAEFHGYFELGVGRTQLVLVGASVGPKSVGGRCLEDGFRHPQILAYPINLGFIEARNGTKVHTPIAILGEKSDAKILDLVAGPCDEQAVALGLRIEGCHSNPRAGIGQGEIPRGRSIKAHGLAMRVKNSAQVNATGSHSTVPLR